MRYPYGSETRKEKAHDYRRYYPTHFLLVAFYRWLQRDYGDWFGNGTLPERTRLQRLLNTHQDWCSLLLATPSFFTVIDSYPIEIFFPIREDRSEQQIAKKGRDKGRWSIGVKLCWLLNEFFH